MQARNTRLGRLRLGGWTALLSATLIGGPAARRPRSPSPTVHVAASNRPWAHAGQRVHITVGPGGEHHGPGLPAYKVILNPRPTDRRVAPAYLAAAHRTDAPTTTVLSRDRHDPTRNGSFRV